MKIVLLIIFTYALCLSCNNRNKSQDKTDASSDKSKARIEITEQTTSHDSLQREIVMCIAPKDYTKNEKIPVTIKNNTNETLEFGDDYTIEKHDGKAWKTFPQYLASLDILHVLAPKEKHDFNLHPDPNNEYAPGKYRIIKEIKGIKLIAYFNITPSNK